MSAECSTENIPPGYKQTEVGIIPEDWDVLKLEDTVKEDSPICYGIVQVGSYTANGVPVLAIKNLNSDYTSNIHRASVEIEIPYLRSRIIPDDVLISVKGTTGRIGVVPHGFYGNISRDIARLRLHENISPKFVFQMLQSNLMQQHLGVATVGTTRMELSIAILKKIRIPLPPTKVEQETIAEALSDADALIESLEQLIVKRRQIKQGAMQELLTGKRRLRGFGKGKGYIQAEIGLIPEDWSVVDYISLGQVIDGDRGTHYPSTCELQDAGYCLFLNAGNVTKAGFRFSDCQFISSEKDKKLNKGKLSRGDVILTTRGTLGNFAYYVDGVPFEHVRINSGMVILRNTSQSVTNTYQYLVLRSQIVESQIERLSFGSAQPQLTVKGISSLKILLPPTPAEQTAIATILSDIDSEITALEEKLSKTRQIKQGMMQELLTGRIRLI